MSADRASTLDALAAALLRVATAVAGDAEPADVFALVADAIRTLLDVGLRRRRALRGSRRTGA